MKNAFTLIAAAFASLATAPTVGATTAPDQVEVRSQKSPFTELGSAITNSRQTRGLISRRSRLGGIFRELNQRQRRKLHRQVPQLRKR
jgi:hypothetical protein